MRSLDEAWWAYRTFLLVYIVPAVVILADGPDLSPRAIDRVVDAWRAGAGTAIAASYGGERGHPVLIARSRWRDVPDDGARALQVGLVPSDDLGSPGGASKVGKSPDVPLVAALPPQGE